MSQVSHGTITVSDLTDITDVFLQYGLALDNAVVDNSYPFNGTDETGWFILTEDTTVNTDKIYFRLSGGIYKIIINPTGNPYAQGWYESAPYPIWQPGYQIWVRQIQIKEGIDEPEYGTPYLDTAVNQINTSIETINDSIYTISTNVTGLDNRLATFFWPGDSSYSGAFAVSTDSITKTNANTYGFNTRVATGLVSIGYNKIPLSEWGINEGLKMYYPILDNEIVVDNKLGMQLTTDALDLYGPTLSYKEYEDTIGNPRELRLYEYSSLDNTYILTQDTTFLSNKTYYKHDIVKGLEITASGIDLYYGANTKSLQINNNGLVIYRNDSNNTKSIELDENSLSFYGSSTTTTDATLSANGLVLTKGGVTAGTHSSIEEQDIATFEYTQENVAINALTINLEADMDGKENIDIIHTNKNIAILPPSLLDEERNSNGVTWRATSNSSYHVSGTATAQSDSIQSRDYGGVINGNLRFLPKGTYTITATKEGTGGGYIHLRGFTSSNTTYRTLVTLSQWNTPQTFTLEDDAFYLIRGRIAADAIVDYEVTIQIEKGTEGTAYIENQYELRTISLGQKVYKGILEAKSGTLTITHQIFDVNFAGATGTQAGGSATNYKGFYSSVVPNIKKPANQEVPDMYCNRLTVTSRYDNYRNTEGIAIHQTEGRAYVYLTDISSMTLAEAQAWLEDNPIQIIYPLEIPQVIQLGTTNITNFENINNIWSNGGIITLEWGNIIYLSTEDFGSYTINGSTFSDWREIIGANFGIRVDGSLYASNVDISGIINAKSGLIGGFEIGNLELYSSGHQSPTSQNNGIYIGPAELVFGPDRTIYFTQAGEGKIGPWYFNNNILVNNTEIVEISFGTNGLNLSKGDEIFSVSLPNSLSGHISINMLEKIIIENGLLTIDASSIKLNNNDLSNSLNLIEQSITSNKNRIDTAFTYIDSYNFYITTTANNNSGYIQLKRKSNNNASSIKITDDKIELSINQNNITTYSGNLMHTTFGEFENLRMRVGTTGSLTWIARSNGHLSLKVVN